MNDSTYYRNSCGHTNLENMRSDLSYKEVMDLRETIGDLKNMIAEATDTDNSKKHNYCHECGAELGKDICCCAQYKADEYVKKIGDKWFKDIENSPFFSLMLEIIEPACQNIHNLESRLKTLASKCNDLE